MTSNLGSENFRKLTSPMGFLSQTVGVEQVQGEVMRELERRFPPEFRNRIDEVVLFAPLTHDEVREIAKHYLAAAGRRRWRRPARRSTSTTRRSSSWSTKGYSLAFGARFLKRFIDEHIKLPISARWKEGSHFSVRAREGRDCRGAVNGGRDARPTRSLESDPDQISRFTRRTRPAPLALGSLSVSGVSFAPASSRLVSP